MLPEVGASELILIAIVALIVVGPKDLPVLLRRLGQFMAKLRNMASEFRASFDEMARQSELDELRKEVEAMRRGQFADMADHDEQMRSTVGEIEQSLSDVGVQLNPPMSYQYDSHAEPAPDAPPVTVAEAPKPARKSRPKTTTTAKKAATGSGTAKGKAAKPAAARAPRARKSAGAGS
jgi:sec-independent protein translocase protein TatB